jgi:hypothetical protein
VWLVAELDLVGMVSFVVALASLRAIYGLWWTTGFPCFIDVVYMRC